MMMSDIASFPKWIVVVFVLACVGLGATLMSDLSDRIMILPIFFFGLVCAFLVVSIQVWVGDVHIRRAQESFRAAR